MILCRRGRPGCESAWGQGGLETRRGFDHVSDMRMPPCKVCGKPITNKVCSGCKKPAKECTCKPKK